MTSPEEQRTLTDLSALLRRDLSTVPPEELAAGIKAAEQTAAQAIEWSGRLIAALHEHAGVSFAGIQEMTGVPVGTAHRRAKPFRTR